MKATREKKTKILKLRLRASELRSIQRASQASDSVSSWCRRALLDAATVKP